MLTSTSRYVIIFLLTDVKLKSECTLHLVDCAANLGFAQITLMTRILPSHLQGLCYKSICLLESNLPEGLTFSKDANTTGSKIREICAISVIRDSDAPLHNRNFIFR